MEMTIIKRKLFCEISPLTYAISEGYKTMIAFVIQGEGIYEVRPNEETDPEFTESYIEAVNAGVEVLFLQCRVSPDEIAIRQNAQ